MVLLNACSEKNVASVIALLKEAAQKGHEVLLENLRNRTKDGFMVLNQALATGSEKNVASVITLLKEVAQKGHEVLLENLRNRTKEGFIVLQDALKSRSEKNVTAVIDLSKKHLFLDEWKDNLIAHAKYGFNLLHFAAKINNIALFNRVIEAIQHAFDHNAEKIIQRLAQERTDRGQYPRSENPDIERILKQYRPPSSNRRYMPHYSRKLSSNDKNKKENVSYKFPMKKGL